MRTCLTWFITLALLGLAGCSSDPGSPRGFSLPVGDPDAGRQAFIELRCHDCHTADRVEHVGGETSDMLFALGGASTRVTTYAELVTSIINPSHRISAQYPESAATADGDSRMHIYNDIMTVRELIDIVAFLQPQYEVVVVSPSSYETYYR